MVQKNGKQTHDFIPVHTQGPPMRGLWQKMASTAVLAIKCMERTERFEYPHLRVCMVGTQGKIGWSRQQPSSPKQGIIIIIIFITREQTQLGTSMWILARVNPCRMGTGVDQLVQWMIQEKGWHLGKRVSCRRIPWRTHFHTRTHWRSYLHHPASWQTEGFPRA